MADLMVSFGFADSDFSLDDFIYNPNPTVERDVFVKTTVTISILLFLAIIVAVMLWRFNLRFRYEIRQRHAAEKQLEKIAYHDALTGLPNRILFSDRLENNIAQVKRHGLMLAVVYLDLDGFKSINDLYGHSSGDKFLIALSKSMLKILREVDTISRFGGDEFLVIFNSLHSKEEVFPILDRLLKDASQMVPVDGNELSCSASIGVTFYPQDKDIDADQLIRQADMAMYKAKSNGKNRYCFYEKE